MGCFIFDHKRRTRFFRYVGNRIQGVGADLKATDCFGFIVIPLNGIGSLLKMNASICRTFLFRALQEAASSILQLWQEEP